MLGSKGNLKIHVWNVGHPFPLQIEAPNHIFSTISQIKDNFNGLYVRNETWYTQVGKYVANYKWSPI